MCVQERAWQGERAVERGLKSQHDSLAGRNGWQAETEMCRPLMALNVAWP